MWMVVPRRFNGAAHSLACTSRLAMAGASPAADASDLIVRHDAAGLDVEECQVRGAMVIARARARPPRFSSGEGSCADESAQGDNEFAASGASSPVSNSKDVGGEKAFAASGAHDKQTASRDEEL